MKCDSCKHKKGGILTNDECGIEGGSYFEYCAKGHWWEESELQNKGIELEKCQDFCEKGTDYEEKGMLPKKYQHKDPKSVVSNFYIGLTSVNINHRFNTITIQHFGQHFASIDNDINNVKNDFDSCFGKGSFRRLEKECKEMLEEGDPGYFYMRYLQF